MSKKHYLTLPILMVICMTLVAITVCAESTVTRGNFITALGKLDKAEGTLSSKFKDVTDTMECAPYVGWAVEKGLIKVNNEGTFNPDEILTREQASLIILNYVKYKGVDSLSVTTPSELDCADRSKIPSWAAEAVKYITNNNLLGYQSGENFNPKAGITDGDIAEIIKYLENECRGKVTELVSVNSFDGYPLKGQLNLPKNEDKISKLIIFVNGSGPNTYDNKRTTGEKEFNYFDIFADELVAMNIGFFSYNTRGVSLGDKPPYYANIDEKAYETYIPNNTVKDMEAFITELKKNPRLKDAKVYLLGWSEGTMVAPIVAERKKVQVDGLLLAGYCNDSMAKVLEWQQTGGSSIIFYKKYFDYNNSKDITKDEFDRDVYKLKSYLGNVSFEYLDANKDSKVNEADFAILLAEDREALFAAIEKGDDKWLKENYSVQLTSAWFWDHKTLRPNSELLPTLDLPIYIFHGVQDANVSVDGVYAIEEAFKTLGKTNLTVNIFNGHDHDLNFMDYVMTGKFSEGFQKLFKVIEEL